jgi:4-hydroxythreonine-4-phosphate dehydrogenase
MNQSSEQNQNISIGITLGDINGIGPEVVIKTLVSIKSIRNVTIVVYGHGKVLSHYKKILNIEDFNFYQYKKGDHLNQQKANVINCWEDHIDVKPGEDNAEGGKCALASLTKAVEDLKNGVIHGLVTAPINKKNIQNDEFKFPGHTEFLTQNFEAKDSLMFLCTENIRVGVTTGHIPLSEVPNAITKDRLKSKINLMLKSVKNDFGIIKPKIAVLGLNPHAGENGLLGKEENEVISPVIEEFKAQGHLVYGPFPADGFFGNNSYSKYDGILAQYHDQGLTPFKTIAFEEGVNFTAGLSIVRTSPDHGTAFDIAGKGVANETSFRAALYMAIDIIKNRREQLT